MATNVEHLGFGLDNLFKRTKKLCPHPKKNCKNVNPNRKNGVPKEAQKIVVQRQKASAELSSPKLGKSLEENNQKMLDVSKDQTSVLNGPRDSMNRHESKNVNDILKPEAAVPEIHSRNSSLQGVKKSENPLETYCKPEICRNYALSRTLNSDKLTEIINKSIKAAVQNLANDTNPPCWRQNKMQGSGAPIQSSSFNDTFIPRLKSSQNKENVTNYTQYSQQAISSGRANVSANICSIYANNGSKRSYTSHRRISPCRSPVRSIPSSKSAISSVICHQSVSKYKLIQCPCLKKRSDQSSKPSKPSKPIKPSKPSKPCKPCKLVKTDNRKMTGNVNIYICSEGTDGTNNNKKKKPPDSTCNSTTITNASCACSSTDVCACQSISSSKTIRDLMEKRNESEKITLKCICGKQPSDCECLSVRSKNNEEEELCVCDMSSLNPTTSNETCREAVDCNLPMPNDSVSSPRGDYCIRAVRSRSSSQNEPSCNRQNFDTSNQVASLEHNSRIYNEKSKFMTDNSGRGDVLQECSCYETFSNYSDRKFNVCGCYDDITNSPARKQREHYAPQTYQNNIDYSRRQDDTCNCCVCKNTSPYSGGRENDIEQFGCCRNKNTSQPQVQPQNNEFCTKPCDSPRNSVCTNRQQPRYSDYCIMEEDETCDATSCQPPCLKQQKSNRIDNFQEDSKKFTKTNSADEEDAIKKQDLSNNGKQDDVIASEVAANVNVSASQTAASSKRISVAELVKSYTNADKSTSSNMISPSTPRSSSPPVVKEKSRSVVQPKKSLEKESKKSSLKWSFDKAKSFIGVKDKPVQPKKSKSPVRTSKPRIEETPKKPAKNTSMPKTPGTSKSSENKIEKTTNDNSVSITKNPSTEKSPSVVKGSAEGNSLIAIKSSVIEDNKSTGALVGSNVTKLSSTKLGSLIADRKNSIQSAANETAQSQVGDQFCQPCCCGAADADICTCQCPQCSCCNRPQEDCRCNGGQELLQEQSCNCCKQSERLCYCCDSNNQQEEYCSKSEDNGFLVCTLCCRPEKDCYCNSDGQTPRRSRSPSNSRDKTVDCCSSVCGKSQICLYCEKPQEKCSCRAPIKKCSYCGMPIDVCNCQNITNTCNACNYDGNICQCKGRVIQNSEEGDQSICVTAWKPRRDVRKYFSRNPGERDNPDCSCCDTVKPYGSDELPYQRLSVFSDVMTELQQKMSELPCCNRCEKTPCCCYLQESKSYQSPINGGRVCNTKQRKSRSRSPPCCHCLGTSPCKCGGRKNSSYQICDRCRTTPCRCRKSRSTQKKPQAKCYYCKCSPCRCELNTTNAASSKSCRCSGSLSRSQEQTPSLPDRNPPNTRPRRCRCRCGSPSCGSSLRGQEMPCG